VIEQLLHDKYCVTVATGENYGNRDDAFCSIFKYIL